MMFSVPQFIDVEDKVAGPLTWKQLFWMIAMGAVILLEFSIFETGPFFAIAVVTALIFVAFAFYRPNGIPLVEFVFHGVFFIFRPKLSFWERTASHSLGETPAAGKSEEATTAGSDRRISEQKLRELAAVLDRRRAKEHTAQK